MRVCNSLRLRNCSLHRHPFEKTIYTYYICIFLVFYYSTNTACILWLIPPITAWKMRDTTRPTQRTYTLLYYKCTLLPYMKITLRSNTPISGIVDEIIYLIGSNLLSHYHMYKANETIIYPNFNIHTFHRVSMILKRW